MRHDAERTYTSTKEADVAWEEPRRQAVTPLDLTFEGLSLHCNVGQSRHTLSLPEVFFDGYSTGVDLTM